MTDGSNAAFLKRALALDALDGTDDLEPGTSGSTRRDTGCEAGARTYRVTVANETRGQPFLAPVVAAHGASAGLFSVGERAGERVRRVAGSPDPGPLCEAAETGDEFGGVAVGDASLVPRDDPADTGRPHRASLRLSADADAGFLTVVSTLIATNDGIVGLDTVPLPDAVGEPRTYFANGYDLGTERNTERFADLLPAAKTLILGGRPEGTVGNDPEIAEDRVVTPHRGILGVGDLPPVVYDWVDPAALVRVERLPHR